MTQSPWWPSRRAAALQRRPAAMGPHTRSLAGWAMEQYPEAEPTQTVRLGAAERQVKAGCDAPQEQHWVAACNYTEGKQPK